MKVFFALCAVALLSACVGNTVATQNATPVQKGKWKTLEYRESGENTGMLVINRDTGMRGSYCIPMISLNGKNVAPINIGEKLELHLAAGRHLLSASPSRNCAANMAEANIEIAKDQTTTFRLGFSKRDIIFIQTGP